MTWPSHQAVCAVLMRRWNQDTELRRCWPLPNRCLSTAFYDLTWKYQDTDHHGDYSECPNLPVVLGQGYLTPSDTPSSCAQVPSLFQVGVGLNVNMRLWCKQWPRCGKITRSNSLLPALPLMLVIQRAHSLISGHSFCSVHIRDVETLFFLSHKFT